LRQRKRNFRISKSTYIAYYSILFTLKNYWNWRKRNKRYYWKIFSTKN